MIIVSTSKSYAKIKDSNKKVLKKYWSLLWPHDFVESLLSDNPKKPKK